VSASTGPVLLAYDGSESSATAIAVAGRLLPGRQAIVCHAWTGLSTALLHRDPSHIPDLLRDAAEQFDGGDLAEAEKTAAAGVLLAHAAGFNADPLPVREGRKTWRTLLEAAERHRTSLIVAGAQGMSGVGRALLGSVSTGLVHHSHLPVLVVPATSGEEDMEGPPLLCYHGSDASKRAIATAGELLDPQPAVVFHFWDSWVAEAPALAALSRTVEGMATELDEIAADQSVNVTEEGVALAEESGFDATGLSERAVGPGWMAVRDAADQHACVAIVVGSRGLTGISAALGSVSNGLVHNSRRPVLIVPAQEEET
jgi:nucleotide-binding universal stress UspA family protein